MANTADRELSVDGDDTPVPRSVNLGEQMKVLFSENKELKEAMQRTNDHMKERFEELGAWKEKQRRERDFLEQKLNEAKRHITALSGQNDELHRKVQGSEDQVQVLLQDLTRTLEQVRSELETSKSAKMTLSDRCRELEQEKRQWQEERPQLQAESQQFRAERQQLQAEREQWEAERQQLRAETNQLTVQLQSLQDVRDTELNQAEEQRKRLVELQESSARLSEENQRMKAEMKKQQVCIEEVKGLRTQLETAEKALVDKQKKLDQMKQEFYKKDNELETVSVFKAQAEVYAADFEAEREARVQIHEEKERLSKQLELVQLQNTNLKQELESLAQQSLSQVQDRHRVSLDGGPERAAATWNQAEARDVEIPVHVCPKCDLVQPDLDTLQIHIMDCID